MALEQELQRRRGKVWRNIARPEQLAPLGEWLIWLAQAGRGWGKTRTGAEWVLECVSQGFRRIALVAPTAADVRDVMVEGESGILNISPANNRPNYEPSKRRLTWRNGAMAFCYSAEEPDRLRGPQHDKAWADELAAWKYPDDTWDMLMMGLRLGSSPQCCVTTTPRPLRLIKQLLASPHTVTVRGTSYDNKDNLAPAFFAQIVARYEGTRLGRQEINGELLEDNPGALWHLPKIDELRVATAPQLKRVVVAIDPAVTANEDSDETGMVVVGLGMDNHGYLLADLSLSASPDAWGRQAVNAFCDHAADRIIGEVNNGGDMIEHVIRTVARDMGVTVSYKAVRASRGKITRAEPVAALNEQGRIHHVGTFPMLEDQLCDYDPLTSKDSPDRLDAYVWAFTELMLESVNSMGLYEFYAAKVQAAQEKAQEILQ